MWYYVAAAAGFIAGFTVRCFLEVSEDGDESNARVRYAETQKYISELEELDARR
jgi:hypothetical protein